MTRTSDVIEAVKAERDEMVHERDMSPPVTKPADVNDGFCWKFAENVHRRLDQPDDVTVLGTGIMNHNHRWIEHDGRHYDAEAPHGVNEWRNLPFWQDLPVSDKVTAKDVGYL